jgi:hypothetical protein
VVASAAAAAAATSVAAADFKAACLAAVDLKIPSERVIYVYIHPR